MKRYIHKSLNVMHILERGDLDVRGVAARNKTISANEYFSKIVQFIEAAPQRRAVLTGIVSERSTEPSENDERLKDLAALKAELAQIGYDKLDSDIDNICFSIKGGNMQLAAKLSDEALDRLNALYDRLDRSYIAKRFQNSQTDDEAKTASIGGVSLTDMLNLLDKEEANRKLRILAVDDVSVVLNTLTSVLSPFYEVFALKNSTQVEKFLTHTTPELFLLDIEMNDMNGFELVPLIRRFKEHEETPIIFITGNASLDNLKDAIALGACDFITKPIDRDILLEKIQKNIVRKRAF